MTMPWRLATLCAISHSLDDYVCLYQTGANRSDPRDVSVVLLRAPHRRSDASPVQYAARKNNRLLRETSIHKGGGTRLCTVATPTGSVTNAIKDVGNESRTHIVRETENSDYTINYTAPGDWISKKLTWSDEANRHLQLDSDWNLTSSTTITPKADSLTEKLTESGYRQRSGSYSTDGKHDFQENQDKHSEYREIKRNGFYKSETTFEGKVTPSGSLTRVFGDGEPTITDQSSVTVTGKGDAKANSYQFASVEVYPRDGDRVYSSNHRSENKEEHFVLGEGAWGSYVWSHGSTSGQESYSKSDFPNARAIRNAYGTIGHRVGMLGVPATSADPVASAIANPDWFDHTTDFFVGFADNASLGLTYLARSGGNYLLGLENLTNYDGAAYSAGGWTATTLDAASLGASGVLKQAAKGIVKRTKSIYAGTLAKSFGDDAARAAARHAAGDCSFWQRAIRGTMCFAAGTKVHLSSVPTDEAAVTVASVEDSFAGRGSILAARQASSRQLLVPIENVPLGATVDAQNPDGSGFDALRGEASHWQRIELVMHRSDGAVLEAELLRHRSETEMLEVGQWYELATDESELSGLAQVVAIDDEVALGDGAGNLVVSRFRTIGSKGVVKVTLSTGERIVGTPGHRTWSVKHQEFIGLAEFEAGDLVDTIDGQASVMRVETGFESQEVFNLEVAGQHVYRVGESGSLVHNNGACDDVAEQAAKSVSDAPNSVITGKLSGEASDAFRTKARDIWQATTGRRAIWDDLQVHHRIPLEWSHIFGKADPNRLSNLVGINGKAHSQVTNAWNAWNAWKRGLNGRTPTQAEVLEQSLRIDELFKGSWVFPK